MGLANGQVTAAEARSGVRKRAALLLAKRAVIRRASVGFLPRECLHRVPIAAPIFLPINCLCRDGGHEKGQLPGGFAGQAWGSPPGTIRQFSLRMAISLRSLGVA